MDWLGWKGWQWLFVLEGLPAVVLGVITWLLLTDRPRDAKWLTPAEREHLEGVLAEEARAKESVQKFTVGQALRTRNVWLLALGIFATNTGGYALTFWMPTTVKNISGGSDLTALMYSGVFYLCGLAGVLYSGFAADRTGNRKWTCIAGQWATGTFLAMSAHPRSIVSYDYDVADPDRSDSALLAAAILGLADAHADACGRGREHRIHQHLREPRRLFRQPPHRVDQGPRRKRQHVSFLPGRLVSIGWGDYQPRSNQAARRTSIPSRRQ